MGSKAMYGLCDWGTSRLRMWLVNAQGVALNEIRSDEGLERIKDGHFSSVLERLLTTIGAPPSLPILICGMAGSRQGWLDAGYSELPLAVEDISRSPVKTNGQRDVRILPGLSQRSPLADVMRGEETMLLGALQEYPQTEGLVVMPGTHSKWVILQQDRVTQFSTFLTGELFNLLSEHSILRHSIQYATSSVTANAAEFCCAVKDMLNGAALSQKLFAVRATSLLKNNQPAAGAATLSGLLIGAELAAMCQQTPQRHATLIGSGELADLYLNAMQLAGFIVTRIDAEDAVRRGLFTAARAIWPLSEGEHL